MATADVVAQLRLLVAEPTEATYSNDVLSARIDANGGNLNVVAGAIWTEKAAALAGLVDMSEGNSSRKLSQGYTNALKMAAQFGVTSTVDTPAASNGRYTRIRPIERV